MNINGTNTLSNICFNKYSRIQQSEGIKYLSEPIKDSVSFGSRAKLLAENMADAPRGKDCISVNTNAEPSRFYLQCVMDKYLSQFVKSTDDDKRSAKKPILEYYTRVKSPNSIREKVVSKYAKIYRDDVNRFCAISVDQLLENFEPCVEVSKEQLVEEAKKIFEFFEPKMPPFENATLFFNQIMTLFESCNIFDFSKVQPNYLKSAFSDIVKNIESEADKTNIDKNKLYINPQSINGIKHYANDIVGARIILADSEPNDTAIILEAIKRAAKDEYIKINSIESNIPDPNKLPSNKSIEDYQYATHNQLSVFANDTNSSFQENMSKSGYMAIHINVELPDPILKLYKGEFKGYSAEIQIIGTDVERLKDIEDLCYKLKDNKNAINTSYLPFKKHFMKYYTKDVMKDFDDYTYALYLAQRALPAHSDTPNTFPTISDLGFEGKVPPELDFNLLKKIKDECDVQYNKLQKAEEDSINNSPAGTICRIKKAGDISTIKNMISCKLK